MERRMSMRQGEAALERLLEQVDDAIDERATGDGMDVYWDAWTALPVYLRDWLLWTVPGWWALPAGVFRRLLLTTAGLIVWNRMPPRAALRRAAEQLRLPAPRPRSRRLAGRARSLRPERVRSASRVPAGLRTASAPRRVLARRPLRAPARRAGWRAPVRRVGGFRRSAFRR